MFHPGLVEAFLRVAEKDGFWLNVVFPGLEGLIHNACQYKTYVEIGPPNFDAIFNFFKIIAYIIDFRSRFTATHSIGVSCCAEAIAGLYGFSDMECHMMTLAGYLHDIGKLAVPIELINKEKKIN